MIRASEVYPSEVYRWLYEVAVEFPEHHPAYGDAWIRDEHIWATDGVRMYGVPLSVCDREDWNDAHCRHHYDEIPYEELDPYFDDGVYPQYVHAGDIQLPLVGLRRTATIPPPMEQVLEAEVREVSTVRPRSLWEALFRAWVSYAHDEQRHRRYEAVLAFRDGLDEVVLVQAAIIQHVLTLPLWLVERIGVGFYRTTTGPGLRLFCNDFIVYIQGLNSRMVQQGAAVYQEISSLRRCNDGEE